MKTRDQLLSEKGYQLQAELTDWVVRNNILRDNEQLTVKLSIGHIQRVHVQHENCSFEPQDILRKNISEIGFSVRLSNCLTNANLLTIGAIVEKSEVDLLKHENFGRKSINELKTFLAQHGLSLRKDGVKESQEAVKHNQV